MLSLIIAFLIAILDQAIKLAVTHYVKPIGQIQVIPNLLSLTYAENTGAAFGILKNQRYFFIIMSIILIAAFLYFIVFKKVTDKVFIAAATLILGGGIGNFIDRILLGYVIDYIELSFFKPICNFADYCICIGSFLLIFYIIFRYQNGNISKKFLVEDKVD